MISKEYIYNLPQDENHALNKITAWINDGSRIFEIGCASGIQTKMLKNELSCLVTGLEIDKQAASHARPHCEKLIVGNIEHIDLSEILVKKYFDAILFADVLEHLNDPLAALKKIKPYL